MRALHSPTQLAGLLDVAFSDEQLAAITAPLAPGVIIAGAGSGKTTVMAARVVWLVGTGRVRPEQVLGLTFTRKAAAELSQRVSASLSRAGVAAGETSDDPGRQLVMTYDAFAGRLVADHGLRIGVESDQRLVTGATPYRLAAQAVMEVRGPLPGLAQWLPATLAQRLIKLDAEMSAHLVDADAVRCHDVEFAKALDDVRLYRGEPTKAVTAARTTIAARDELLRLVADFRQLKRQRGLVEFADQMAQAARLASSPEVSALLRERFAVVLLDEYQDTSSAQARLLRGLFSGPDPDHGRGHPVTAVGDPFQAIYGWRGAAPSNILQFADDFRLPDGSAAHSYSLRVNRRSRPLILAAANQLAAGLRADQRLQVAAAAGGDDQLLRAPQDASGGQITVASFDTWPEEVEWVADQVVLAHQSLRVPKWSQMAVLTRANAPIGAVYQALTERGVPVEIVGLGGLLEVPEIAEIVATLKLIEDVTANPEVVRLLSGQRWRIGPRDLVVLVDRARFLANAVEVAGRNETDRNAMGVNIDVTSRYCLMDAVEDLGQAPFSPEARQRLTEFAEELRALRRHHDEPALELVRRVIAASGVGLELDSDVDWFATGRAHQLTQFVEAVAGYVDIDGDGALSGLLAWLDAELDNAEGLDQAVPSNLDSVKLLTAHRAKGLEWDLVFLPGLCDGTFPSNQPPDYWVNQAAVLPAELRGDRDWVPQLAEVTSKQLSETYRKELAGAQGQAEDRLIYVAVTRAREMLIASTHHWFPGRKTARGPSPYFEVLHRIAADHGEVAHFCEVSAVNPLGQQVPQLPWPAEVDEARLDALRQAASMVRQVLQEGPGGPPVMGLDAHEQGHQWHRIAESLVAEARQRRRRDSEVPLPASVSASGLLLANRDAARFAAQLLRPMPRQVGRQAGVGTRFHAWLQERFGTTTLFDPEEVEEEAGEVGEPAAELLLRRLIAAFKRGRYAHRTPHFVEEPFVLMLAGQQIRGRIDAVFATPGDPDHDYQVVDWKTSDQPADPLQLSLYRLAWAHSAGLPTTRVDAVFYHVLSDEVERPARLLDEAELIDLLESLG